MIVNQAAISGIYKSFNTLFQSALDQAKPVKDRVAMTVPSNARSNTYAWIDNLPMLREWLGERVVRDLAAHGYEIVNKNYEGTVSVDRNDIEDDQIGAYRPIIEMLAYNAAMHPDKLIFDLLASGFTSTCFDGQYFFDTDHPVAGSSVSNYGGGSSSPWYLLCTSFPVRPLIFQSRQTPKFVSMDRETDENVFMRRKFIYGVESRCSVGFGLWQLAYGSKQTLDTTNYASARAAMMGLRNEEGTPLGIVPSLLVVGRTGEAAGKAIVDAQFNPDGGSNVWFRSAELLVVPWLA